ncbi:SUMO-activating enzyme subunit 1 [Toxorhynchites rutilus septentrionalis]|uniref:SUMO-activating enzyme subunit 1 n=1 Tax=Toxorhynchites rutilus septentrionalis TaxID=329112 RepID=UPI002479399E|nr:SUMO-activating enzyme subunit 1 [Toxorhynchites rutilus septentrionalis]
MVETNGIELTEQEAELYDRQIRLWGLDSQKRLRSARILIAGINGLGAEIAKNIILSGVKSVTLLDDQNVKEDDFCSQFLAPRSSLGTNRAEASLGRAQQLNPMVELKADKGELSKKSNDYFKNFDVVCIIAAPTLELLRIDEACREAGVKFFAADLWGMFGYSFADLQEHNFAEDVVKHKIVSKPNEKTKTELVTSTVKRILKYPAFQALLDFDYKAQSYARKLKRSGPALPLLRVLQKFRDDENRDPLYSDRDADLLKLMKIRDEIAAELIPNSALTHLFAQISPAAAIVGGAVAHEIIKTVSQKEAPHHNVFLFDPESCCGFIESIGTDALKNN